MSAAPPLDVKVVYTASSRSRRGRRSIRTSRPTKPSRLILLGILNLTAAGGLYYGTWWWADKELRPKIIMNTPIPGVDINTGFDQLFPGPGVPAAPRSTRIAQKSSPKKQTNNVVSSATFFVGSAVGWEALETLAACALALSGGALLGRAGGSRWRRAGKLLSLFTALALIGIVYHVGTKYGREFTPNQLRTVVGVLTLLTGVLGLAIGRGAGRLTYLAAIMLILAAAGSAMGLWIGTSYDAIKPHELPTALMPSMVLVFILHSLWGWILVPIASRIGR